MKNKIAWILAISVIATNTMPVANVYANEVIKKKATTIENEVSKRMIVENFKMINNPNLSKYNEKFKVEVKSIENNGGSYPGTNINNAIDGKLNTHWEARNRNTTEFKNVVEMELAEATDINRLAYATRQDGAKGKGYPTSAKIYVSESGNNNDYTLAGEVTESKVTGGMVEFKFDTVRAKKVKFVFDKANDEWASASEFWFYKEDKVLDNMERLFTDSRKAKVNPEFASEEKLNALEKECEGHPFYNEFKSEIEDAKILINEKEIEATTAKVSKSRPFYSKNKEAYEKVYKVPTSDITKVESLGGNLNRDVPTSNMIDGNINTYWETGRGTSDSFKNEVTFTFNEPKTLDRVGYRSAWNTVGFATDFEIWGSNTSEGDTFQLVSSGKTTKTADVVEFKFEPTSFKRLKFKFKNNGAATISEMMFYSPDETLDKMNILFVDDKKNKVNPELASTEQLNRLESACKKHPFYSEFKNDIEDAKQVIVGNNVEYVDAKVSKFKNFGSPELKVYDAIYKIPVSKITTNGGHWSDNTVDRAIDGDINTNWHSNDRNSDTHTNEVIMTLDELQTLDKVVYTSPRDRGFAEAFEIYTSKTSQGDTFEKVTSGRATRTDDSIAIKFKPTQAKRVKFVFKQGYEGWALASEFGIYKEDTILDKMSRLFTDNTVTKVSDEFNSLDKLKALEDECKKHLFYNDFKEDLYNARGLLEQGKVESSIAVTKKFDYLNNKEYIEQFRIPYDKIKKVTNNAGNYDRQVIGNVIDGKIDTYWETNKYNTDNWKNEITVEFKEPITIDRIAYGARQSDRKGFIEGFEIYGSNTTKGDDFHLVATGKANSTSGLVEAKFNQITFRRLKLKAIKSNQNWPTLNEIMFFKKDTVVDKVDDLFTDELKNKLNEQYNSLDKLEALEKEVMTHPLKEELIGDIKMAKEVLSSPGKFQSNIFELESRGDSIKESQKRKVWNFQDWQPTGLAVKSGEEINVYVDAEPGAPLPRLVFKQMDSAHNGLANIDLKRGYNKIRIPEVDVNSLRPGTAKAGVLYTVNPYTPEQQGRKPKIRIEGGVAYPHFIKGVDNDEQVMEKLRAYNEKLKADPNLPDVFDVFSDKTLVNVKATYALDWYTKNNKLPSSTANKSDEVIKETMKYWGFDGSSEINSDWNFRYVSMVKYLDHGGFMNAGNGITGFNKAEQGGALDVNTGWGFAHEMGHNFDTNNRTIPEVTNNSLPLHYQMIKGQHSKLYDQNLLENKIFPKVSKEDYSHNEWYPDNDYSQLTHIAPLWQLQLYDNTFWPRFEKEFRARNIGGGSRENIHEAWAVVASDVLKLDLNEHFARHGFYVSEATAKHMSKYPKPTKKLWYLNDNKYLNKGEGFNEDVKCDVKIKSSNNSVKLDMKIDKTNANSLLGYEIVKDGKIIGFTMKDSFVDNNAKLSDKHEYKVVTYDINLNISEGTSVNSHQPVLQTIEGVTLGLHEEFNPLDYVKATDYRGNALGNIKVISNVNNKVKGDYTITYEVEDNGTTVKQTIPVQVVSKCDYLSDREWDNVETQWGTPSRNNSIKGRTLGDIRTYDKGIRIHANGSATYNLGEHNYDNFEVKVGVDMNLKAQNASSISFKIIGDGKTLAATKVMKHADDMQYIKVPIKGVKQLKIEVSNGGNGNESDHGIFVEPKLTTNNAKPKLTIPKSQSVKVGQTLEDVVGAYTATDAEEGDLTENVTVTGQDKVNFNRVGNYTITYSVVDKDGNRTETSRVISVVDMQDFKYLSDIDWKTAKSGWGKVTKDRTVDNNPVRLTDEDNKQVEYKKGIGTHAHSEIVYDLRGKNVDMFSSFIGVDREMYNSPASVEFEIYVDGSRVYNSGVMQARDSQKFVEVDLAGAKELKLVVNDGGNGIGSDHADWADAKLHFVNEDRVYKEELVKLVEEGKKLNEDDYTEESFSDFEGKLIKAYEVLNKEKATQEDIDNATKELQETTQALVKVNLEEVVNVPDEYLNFAVRKALGKQEGDLTVGDMRSITNLKAGDGVDSLEGLQYAKNLEALTVGSGSIKDLRILGNLSKLKNVKFGEQFIPVNEVYPKDNVVTVNTEAYGIKGNNIATKVSIVTKYGEVVKEQTLDGTRKEATVDISDVAPGYYSVQVYYGNENISGVLIYMTHIG